MKDYPSFSSLPGLAPSTVLSVACLKGSQRASANMYAHYTPVLSKVVLEEVSRGVENTSSSPSSTPTSSCGLESDCLLASISRLKSSQSRHGGTDLQTEAGFYIGGQLGLHREPLIKRGGWS